MNSKFKIKNYLFLAIILVACFGFFHPAQATSGRGSFSASIFVNPSGSIASKAIIGKAEEFRMATDANGFPLCQGKFMSSWVAAATSSIAISIGQWSQITCVFNTTDLKIYVNGILAGTQAISGIPVTANVWKIGKDDSAGTPYGILAGLVDEYKFYSYSLTADEIKIDYNKNAALKLGSYSTDVNGVASSSASAIYCVPGSTDPCAPPVGEWKFEEGSGQSAQDTSGNGNTGTLGTVSTPDSADPVYANGKVGKGLKFDGADDYVDVGDITDGLSQVTICAWAKSAVADFGREMSIARESAQINLQRRDDSNQQFYFLVYNDSTSVAALGDTFYTDTNWHYVCGVYNGATVDLYVDGKDDEAAVNSLTGTVRSTVANLQISGSDFWSGMLDQARVYNYARTPAQIAWEYNQGAPVGHWKMDECQGGVIHDSSPNKNNGQLYIGTGGTQTATGTCQTADTVWGNGASGKRNASLNFDGSDDYVNQPTSVSGVQSVSFWAYPTSNSQSFLQLTGGAGAKIITSSNGTVSANGFASPTIYVNGIANGKVLASTWNYITVTTGTAITANAIKLGLVGATYYSGKLDDIQIFNYTLTPVQIKNLYTGGAVRFGQ
ncbi:MAG: LamG domain-containing protein [Patescibacteria group bacterium]|jgi:hypothetical protein